MRIALFSECYCPVTNGVVTSMQTLRDVLRSWGHTVYVFAPGSEQPEDDADVFRLPELPFPRHPYHFARPFPRLNFDFAALGVEVIHCQHPFTVGRLGADTARRYSIPMVYTAHSLYDTMATYSKSPLMRTMGAEAARGVTRRFCARADYVIAPSRHTRDELRNGGVKARFAVVPSGIHPPVIRPEARAEMRAGIGLSDETPLILYLGRLGPEKRLDVLMQAVALLNHRSLPGAAADFRLGIVGDGQCRQELELMAMELGIQKHVFFPGSVPHTSIGDWYAAGDVFSLPAPAETQGLVLLEAMSAGLPCVAADYGGPREIVVQGKTGWRVPIEAEAFANALETLLRDPNLRQSMGRNGQQRAQTFTPEAMSKAVLAVYDSVLRLPRPAKPAGTRSASSLMEPLRRKPSFPLRSRTNRRRWPGL